MMVIFFHAARLALVVFDPFLTSRPIAEVLERMPLGILINHRNYYGFSSLTFYTNRDALIYNGRYFNLEYGSYAPGAPNVFIDDAKFKELWNTPERYYLVTFAERVGEIEKVVGREALNVVISSGGKFLFTNHPLQSATKTP